MPIVRIYDFPEGTLDRYEKIIENYDGPLSSGYLVHAMGSTGKGIQAVDVFETTEARDRIAELVAKNCIAYGLGEPIITEFETHTLLRA